MAFALSARIGRSYPPFVVHGFHPYIRLLGAAEVRVFRKGSFPSCEASAEAGVDTKVICLTGLVSTWITTGLTSRLSISGPLLE